MQSDDRELLLSTCHTDDGQLSISEMMAKPLMLSMHGNSQEQLHHQRHMYTDLHTLMSI